MFPRSFFLDLHNHVSAPGSDYPQGTYNYKGARISLSHTKINISPFGGCFLPTISAKILLISCWVDPDGHIEPCLKNHSSSYMFHSYLDKFCIKEIVNGGLTGPFGNVPFTRYQLSPMMTAAKKPSGRRPVFDASYGSSQQYHTPGLLLGPPCCVRLPLAGLSGSIDLVYWSRCPHVEERLIKILLQLPLDPVDYWRTGFVRRQYYFFFIAYMFGLRHAGRAGQAITSASIWSHKRSGLDYDGELFNALNYSDDLCGCEEGVRAMVSFLKIADLIQQLGLDEPEDKASSPATQMEYLGVCFDSVSLISANKIADLRDLLFRWLHKTTCSKRCL